MPPDYWLRLAELTYDFTLACVLVAAIAIARALDSVFGPLNDEARDA